MMERGAVSIAPDEAVTTSLKLQKLNGSAPSVAAAPAIQPENTALYSNGQNGVHEQIEDILSNACPRAVHTNGFSANGKAHQGEEQEPLEGLNQIRIEEEVAEEPAGKGIVPKEFLDQFPPENTIGALMERGLFPPSKTESPAFWKNGSNGHHAPETQEEPQGPLFTAVQSPIPSLNDSHASEISDVPTAEKPSSNGHHPEETFLPGTSLNEEPAPLPAKQSKFWEWATSTYHKLRKSVPHTNGAAPLHEMRKPAQVEHEIVAELLPRNFRELYGVFHGAFGSRLRPVVEFRKQTPDSPLYVQVNLHIQPDTKPYPLIPFYRKMRHMERMEDLPVDDTFVNAMGALEAINKALSDNGQPELPFE